jgi:hypothetical protein
MSKSVVEVVYINGSKSYNSTYKSTGHSKMIIIQDDDDDEKFPQPRLCLLRRWPNFDAGFGFSLFEDLLNSTASLKVENIMKNSPAEIGGLRVNDILVEVNGEYVEYKSFFHLIEILKQAFDNNQIELLVLSDDDANWYKERGIVVNSKFPNIQYCETPYYGYKFRDFDSKEINSNIIGFDDTRHLNTHLSSSKPFKSTYVLNTNEDKVYKYSKLLKKSQSLRHNIDDIQNDAEEDSTSSNDSLPNKVNTGLLHDNWNNIMDQHLNNKYGHKSDDKTKKSHTIRLDKSDSKGERSRSLNSPRNNDEQKAFSFLFSGREEFNPSSYSNYTSSTPAKDRNAFSKYFIFVFFKRSFIKILSK